MTNFSQLGYFDVYSTAMQSLGNLRLDEDKLRYRVVEIAELAGQDGDVEEYSMEVFSDSTVRTGLSGLDPAVNFLPEFDQRRVKYLINDLLMAASLVPTREVSPSGRKFPGTPKVHQRQAAEVVSIHLLSGTLQKLLDLLTQEINPLDSEDISPLRYNEYDPAPQRLASISLLNLSSTLRKAMRKNPIFDSILDSDSLTDFLFTSNGHDEQQFLNSCVASSVNTDLKGRTVTLLGLIEVGRELVRKERKRLEDLEISHPEILDVEEGPLLGGSRTLRVALTETLNDAEVEFDDLGAKLQEYARPGAKRKVEDLRVVNVKESGQLNALTDRWSKTMQKLSMIGDLEDADDYSVDRFSISTEKSIPGSWIVSGLIALPAVFDRVGRRMQGASEEYERNFEDQVVSNGVDWDSEDQSLTDSVDSASDREVWIEALWRLTQAMGGSTLSAPGHRLFLKAVRRDGVNYFALSDPKYSGYQYMNYEEFLDWIASSEAEMPSPFLAQIWPIVMQIDEGMLNGEAEVIEPEAQVAEVIDGHPNHDGYSGDDGYPDHEGYSGDEAGEEAEGDQLQGDEADLEDREPLPHSGSDPWALARWQLAGIDPYQLLFEQNKVALHELKYDVWEPYWIGDMHPYLGGSHNFVVVIGQHHHDWFYQYLLINDPAPMGYIMKLAGRLRVGSSRWLVKGDKDWFPYVKEEIRRCGHPGEVKGENSDIDQQEVIGWENQRALKQEIAVGGTIDCWTTHDNILIGSHHPSILYLSDPPDDQPMARIRKGRKHYYVTILNHSDDGFQWVKEAIEATGTDRKVERE